MSVLLSRSFPSRYGAPVIDRFDPRIFQLTFFAKCMSCDFCHDSCCQFGVDIEMPRVAALDKHRDELEAYLGVPRSEWFRDDPDDFGIETEPTTLALEADLDDHISTTKGCYTGQEIVARIHTYGQTNRKLCLLWLGPGAAITAPQPLHEIEDQMAVGRVMHAVPVPGHAARLGVGFLSKDFQARGSQLALADGGACEVIGYAPLPA